MKNTHNDNALKHSTFRLSSASSSKAFLLCAIRLSSVGVILSLSESLMTLVAVPKYPLCVSAPLRAIHHKFTPLGLTAIARFTSK
jgi:hypothetical protein